MWDRRGAGLTNVVEKIGESVAYFHGVADKVTDILFPLVPDWFYPHRSGWEIAMWNHWARYYQTDGELGEEPPELIRRLQNWGDELRTATTEAHRTKAVRALLEAAAENLWTIGTVGQARTRWSSPRASGT